MLAFNHLPFGWLLPAIFQRIMNSLLQGLPGVLGYLDDIIVMGHTVKEHLESLDRVLTKLEQAGLRLNEAKCIQLDIWHRRLNFLGCD